jgi:hypothetical protein
LGIHVSGKRGKGLGAGASLLSSELVQLLPVKHKNKSMFLELAAK